MVVLRALGSEGSGGGLEPAAAVEVLVGFDMAVALGPVSPGRLLAANIRPSRQRSTNSPTDALVCPALLSQGFGGDGVAIYSML